MNQSWSWVLTAVGLLAAYLTGRKLRIGWLVSLAVQVVWVVYSLTTRQYGFLAAVVFAVPIYVKNWWQWGGREDVLRIVARMGGDTL